jgi:hypothetical protein
MCNHRKLLPWIVVVVSIRVKLTITRRYGGGPARNGWSAPLRVSIRAAFVQARSAAASCVSGTGRYFTYSFGTTCQKCGTARPQSCSSMRA